MRRRGEGDAPLPGAPGRTWGRGGATAASRGAARESSAHGQACFRAGVGGSTTFLFVTLLDLLSFLLSISDQERKKPTVRKGR